MLWCNLTLIIVALFGTIVEVLQRLQNRAAGVITGSTFDIRSDDVRNMLGWESLDQRRDYIKSIYTYKMINDLAAPNLKQLFQRCNEGDSPHRRPSRAPS